MPVQSNATTEEELALVKSYAKSLSKERRKLDYSVQFDKRNVTIINDDESPVKMTRKAFSAWADGGFGPLAADEGPGKQTATPPPKQATDAALNSLVSDAFTVAMEERENDHGRNAARFRRGELMIRLEGLASANGTTIKTALAELNRQLVNMASDHMVPDMKIITDSEASTTKRVVQAFGSAGEFDLTDAINPNTGDPLVNDAGEPPTVALTDVALNKLYALAEFADDVDRDKLLSFAHRNSEKVVKKAKAIAKNRGIALKSIITKLNKHRQEGQHAVTGDPVRVQPNEKEAMVFLRNLAGEAPAPDVATIKTSRAWFESTWEPLKKLGAAIMKRYHPELVNPTSGELSNVFVLERTITQYFGVHESEGVQRFLGALVEAQDLTEAQASSFLEDFVYDQERDEWVLADPDSEAYVEESDEPERRDYDGDELDELDEDEDDGFDGDEEFDDENGSDDDF